jgi:hypothetical protein
MTQPYNDLRARATQLLKAYGFEAKLKELHQLESQMVNPALCMTLPTTVLQNMASLQPSWFHGCIF